MNHILNIKIDISTYIILLLSLLAGYFEYVFLLLFIIIVHEMGHYLIGKLLNLNMSEIRIYAFGGVTLMDEDLNSNIFKEIIMLLAGPLSQLLLLLLIILLYNKSYVNFYTYSKFLDVNYLLFSFNLLPILPLDGGKLMNNILDLVLPFRLSHRISIIISFIFLPSLFIIDNKIFVTVLFLFLFIKLLEEINSDKDRLNKLILERKFNNYNFKKTIVIDNINKVKRNINYIISNTK